MPQKDLLDAALAGEDWEPEDAEQEAAPEEPEGQEPEESGKEEALTEKVSEEEEKAEPGEPEPEEPADVSGFKRALKAARGDAKAERKRRKAEEQARSTLERELSELRGRFSQFEQQHAPKPEKPAGMSPEEFERRLLDNPMELFNEFGGRLVQQVKAEAFNQHVLSTEAVIAQLNDDYGQAKEAFVEEARKRQYLWQYAADENVPAMFILNEGRRLLAQKNSGGDEVAQLKARIAELEGRAPASSPQQKPKIPKSLVGAPAQGVADTKGWQPHSFDDLYDE